MATDWSKLWQDLNDYQRGYLLAIYEQDQAQERTERTRAAKGYYSRPAKEWRWIQYDDIPDGYTPPLQYQLRKAGLVDPDTGDTFQALESRGYIQTETRPVDTVLGVMSVLGVTITSKGRELVRANTNHKAPKRRPRGQLNQGQWETLEKLYRAGENGMDYQDLWWPWCMRLRDYTPALLEERRSGYSSNGMTQYRVYISDAGRNFYESRRAEYEQLYPPPPDGETTIPLQPPADRDRPAQDSVTVTTPPPLRPMPLIDYTITCADCGQVVTLRRYPGYTPSRCAPCATARRRAQSQERAKNRSQKPR